MSIDLHVDITSPPAWLDLLAAAHVACRQILGRDDIPEPIVVEQWSGGTRAPLVGGSVGIDGMYILGIPGFDDGASWIEFSLHRIPSSDDRMLTEQADADAPLCGWMAVRASRFSPMKTVLAAAVAIALARLYATTVIDSGCSWSGTYELSPELFLNRIRVKVPCRTLLRTAFNFHERLPANQA